MISALHLLWIIPLSGTMRMLLTALITVNRDDKDR